MSKIVLKIRLPKGFPDKYRDALISTANLCTVKKHLLNPPAFEIVTEVA